MEGVGPRAATALSDMKLNIVGSTYPPPVTVTLRPSLYQYFYEHACQSDSS